MLVGTEMREGREEVGSVEAVYDLGGGHGIVPSVDNLGLVILFLDLVSIWWVGGGRDEGGDDGAEERGY